MSGYIKYDSEIYSEELYSLTESEYDEVMADDWQGYSEWSQDVEAANWNGAQSVNGILIKKACEHLTCSHFKCERNPRVGAISI